MSVRNKRKLLRWLGCTLVVFPLLLFINFKLASWYRGTTMNINFPSVKPLELLGKMSAGHGIASGSQQTEVLAAFRHCWQAYTKYAFGHDELDPVGRRPAGGTVYLASTLVGSMSTALVMNHTQYFYAMDDWIDKNLNFNQDHFVNIYQISSEILSALTSAHILSGHQQPLQEAQDLLKELLPAFRNSRFPRRFFNLLTKQSRGILVTISDISTLTLDITLLAKYSNNQQIHSLSKSLIVQLVNITQTAMKQHGFVPTFYNTRTKALIVNNNSTFSVNRNSVRLYDTLLKLWILESSKQDSKSTFYHLFVKVISAVTDKLIIYGTILSNDNVYLSDVVMNTNHSIHIMDHGSCALPGSLALHYLHRAHITESSPLKEKLLQVAEHLARTCMRFYVSVRSGLSPETVKYNPNTDILREPKREDYNGLWSDTVESLYILHEVTNKVKYRRWGWNIFVNMRRSAFVKNTCFASTVNLNDNKQSQKLPRTASTLFAATLKYLYLLLGEDRSIINPKKWMFSSAGHVFKI